MKRAKGSQGEPFDENRISFTLNSHFCAPLVFFFHLIQSPSGKEMAGNAMAQEGRVEVRKGERKEGRKDRKRKRKKEREKERKKVRK